MLLYHIPLPVTVILVVSTTLLAANLWLLCLCLHWVWTPNNPWPHGSPWPVSHTVTCKRRKPNVVPTKLSLLTCTSCTRRPNSELRPFTRNLCWFLVFVPTLGMMVSLEVGQASTYSPTSLLTGPGPRGPGSCWRSCSSSSSMVGLSASCAFMLLSARRTARWMADTG